VLGGLFQRGRTTTSLYAGFALSICCRISRSAGLAPSAAIPAIKARACLMALFPKNLRSGAALAQPRRRCVDSLMFLRANLDRRGVLNRVISCSLSAQACAVCMVVTVAGVFYSRVRRVILQRGLRML
jgi:hypothetical protein